MFYGITIDTLVTLTALGIIWGKDLAEVSANGLDFLDHLVLEGHNGKGEALKSNVEFLKKKTERILRF